MKLSPTSVTIQGGSRHTPMKRTTFGCLMALMMLTCINSTDPGVLCLSAIYSGGLEIECMATMQIGHSNVTSRDNCLKADMFVTAAHVLVH